MRIAFRASLGARSTSFWFTKFRSTGALSSTASSTFLLKLCSPGSSSLFGGARPRELALKEAGRDYRKEDAALSRGGVRRRESNEERALKSDIAALAERLGANPDDDAVLSLRREALGRRVRRRAAVGAAPPARLALDGLVGERLAREAAEAAARIASLHPAVLADILATLPGVDLADTGVAAMLALPAAGTGAATLPVELWQRCLGFLDRGDWPRR